MIRWALPTHPFWKWLVLSNVTFASFIGVISAVAGFVADSTVRGALMLSRDDEQWIAISFIMMLGIMLPLAIHFAERYGYKRLFIIGTAVFSLGSLFNVLAFDFYTFLFSRMVAGAGAGALFPLSIVIIDQIFPKDELTFPISLYTGISFGFGTAFGFWMGGYGTQYIGWEFSFLLCFLLSLLVLWATWALHQETPPTEEGKKRFDALGYILFVLFLASLLNMLSSAKAEWNVEGWTSPFTLGCIAIALISLLSLIPLELKHENPLIVFSLFKIHSFLLGCIAIACVGAVLYATLILSTAFVDQVLLYEKHTVGVFLAPTGALLGVLGCSAAFFSQPKNTRAMTLIGLSFVVLGCFLGMNTTMYSSHIKILGVYLLRYLGVALALGPATALALEKVPKNASGTASFLIIFCRQVGGTLGFLVAHVITIQRTEFHRQMFGAQVHIDSARFQEVASGLQDRLSQMLGDTADLAFTQSVGIIRENLTLQAVVAAMNDAFFLLGAVAGLITFFLALDAIRKGKKSATKEA